MSISYCEPCDKHIDTDFDAEHFSSEEHQENFLAMKREAYKPMCEEDGCDEPAVSEWHAVDEDGDTYSTYRCEAHPEEDPDYEERPL